MQQVKYFLRAIGKPSPTVDESVVTSSDAETDLAFNYLSQGWTIQSTHYVGGLRDAANNDIAYRILHVLVREEPEITVKEPIAGKDKK